MFPPSSGAVQRSVRVIVAMRKELKDKEELKAHLSKLQLADAGVDPR